MYLGFSCYNLFAVSFCVNWVLFTLVKWLAGKIVSEIAYNVSKGILNLLYCTIPYCMLHSVCLSVCLFVCLSVWPLCLVDLFHLINSFHKLQCFCQLWSLVNGHCMKMSPDKGLSSGLWGYIKLKQQDVAWHNWQSIVCAVNRTVADLLS